MMMRQRVPSLQCTILVPNLLFRTTAASSSAGGRTMILILLLHFGFVALSQGSFYAPTAPTTTSFLRLPIGSPCQLKQNPQIVASSSTELCCICVNCARVTNCAAYHFVESKHDQPHMTDHPTFTPREGSPTIHVNWRTTSTTSSSDEQPQQPALPTSTLENDEQATAYDKLPQITYEYDVVACADFVEDIGCWVRNMPEAIKIANPHFVPP